MDYVERSPLSKLGCTPEAHVLSEGDMAVDLEDDEAAIVVDNGHSRGIVQQEDPRAEETK